jgi:hypothetical protein
MHCTLGLKDSKALLLGAFPAKAVEARGRVARAAMSPDQLCLPVTGMSRQFDQGRRHSCAGALGQIAR